jgi:hypothetical protein
MVQSLTTTKEVMEALGGIAAVAVLTGSDYKAAENWRRFETFPSKHFLVMSTALERTGFAAPPTLWGMTTPAQVAS